MQVGVAERDALGDLLRAAGLHEYQLAPLDHLLLNVRARAWALRSDRSRSCHEVMVADAAAVVSRRISRAFPPTRLRAMASEDQLLAAAAAAKPFAVAGEEVVGVLVADPFDHGLVFLCALGPPAEDDDDDPDDVPELGWIAVDPEGLALSGDERPELAAALVATREAALASAAFGAGLRVARTGYIDQLADAARGLAISTQ